MAVARLPGKVKEKHGDDVRVVLRSADGETLVREAIEKATQWTPSVDDEKYDERPEVIVTMNEAVVTDEVVCHLGKLGHDTPWVRQERANQLEVFVRGGVLVQVIKSDDLGDKGQLAIRDLPPGIIRERITQACSLMIEKETDDDLRVVATRPPRWLIEAVYRRGNYDGKVRPLSGIIESPTIRVDGSLIQSPGYDPQTGLIYRPSVAFPRVGENPSREEASASLVRLREVLTDFPMLDDSDASAWVALVLSMIGRPCIAGYVPLFGVTANVRGAGKSLLVERR